MSTVIPSSVRIPSTTFVLGNGLRVVVHEDRAAPIVTVHLMFRAGSRHERPGRTGLAHLLEHLFFEGSQHAPKGHFDDVLERVGGTNNGSTWLDRTNYYETVPTHAVELPLWLERDRLAFFLPVLTEEVLELQRGVVMNERRQAYENRPYGMADQRLSEMLFGPDHPYSWPTIGYMADLEAITLDDARAFYGRYYAPGNAVLVFAGDIDHDRAVELATRYFGDLPAAPLVSADSVDSVDSVDSADSVDSTDSVDAIGSGDSVDSAAPADSIDAAGPADASGSTAIPAVPVVAREVMEDEVSFPRIFQAYATPPYGTADWVALDVLAYLLADGDSSRLQRALVRDGRIAQDVDTFLYPTALCGIFGLVATARSEIEPEALEAEVRRVIDDVIANGVAEHEVTGAVRRARRDQVSELATVEERADALAYAATVLGSADAVNEVMDAYGAVTADDVRRVAADYLSAERCATLVVVPREEEEVADVA